jgi:hypothetical protein
MAAGGNERISGYFGGQTPSGSKKPLFRSAFGFIISDAPHLRNPYLTKVTNQLRSTFPVTYADRDTFSISLELLK